jgi:hypothetical protein
MHAILLNRYSETPVGTGNFDAPGILSQTLRTEITCPLDVFEQ